MANRSTRRTLKRDSNATGTIPNSVADTNGSTPTEFAGTQTDEPIVDGNGSNSNDKSDNVGNIGYVEIDPAKLGEFITGGGTTDSGNSDSEPRKRRAYTRRNGKRTGTEKAQASIAPFVQMAHTWAATLLATPELMLDAKEVDALTNAYETFCEYHDVPLMTPKRMSELQLIGVLGMTYGTRFVAIMNRKKAERHRKLHVIQPQQQPQPQTVDAGRIYEV